MFYINILTGIIIEFKNTLQLIIFIKNNIMFTFVLSFIAQILQIILIVLYEINRI